MSHQDTPRYLAASPAPGGLFAPRMRIETLAVHAGHAADPSTGAVTPPIHLSTTFERDLDGGFRAGHVYARTSNPNRDALEEAMAALEGGATAIAYRSGSAATMSVVQAPSPGDHVIAPHDAYYGSLRQLRESLARSGLEHDAVDMTDADAVARFGAHHARRVGGDAVQPARPRRGHRAPRRPGTYCWRALRGRQHVGDTGASASARARRRPGDALHHQVPRRAHGSARPRQRCGSWRAMS